MVNGVRKGLVIGRIDRNIIRSGRIGGRKNDGNDVQELHIKAVKKIATYQWAPGTDNSALRPTFFLDR